MPAVHVPDRFDLRMAYNALRVERSWHCTFDHALAHPQLSKLIHARALQVLRQRAARIARLRDLKQLAAEGPDE